MVKGEIESVLRTAHRFLQGARSGNLLCREMGLGYGSSGVFRNFRRDYWTLFSIARELNLTVSDLAADDSASARPVYPELLAASERIWQVVRALPSEQAAVVLLRAQGLSWQKISKQFPGRVFFSLTDDYHRALDQIAEMSEINFLLYFTKKPTKVNKLTKSRTEDSISFGSFRQSEELVGA